MAALGAEVLVFVITETYSGGHFFFLRRGGERSEPEWSGSGFGLRFA